MDHRRPPTTQELDGLIKEIKALSGDELAAQLSTFGFEPDATAAEALRGLVDKLADGDASQLIAFLQDLFASPSPNHALLNVTRFLDVVGPASALLNTLAGGKPIRQILATIFGSSQYMADIIIRNPGYLYWLIEKSTWDGEDSVDAYERLLHNDITNFETLDSQLNAARRFQRRLLLKIGTKDLMGLSTIEETTSHLSYLADTIAGAALDLIWQDLAQPDHRPKPTGLAVLAMGKLGGNELNYSSDIDLVYVCQDTDEKTHAFFHKVASRLTTALSEVSTEGYFYRVDLRLRPDGDVGPLVNSVTSARIYYENRGRPWEFQALLKARTIAGDANVGREFLASVSGLIFNPSLSYSPVESIALMRQRIRSNISPAERSFNIKLMEGGIRDIEFITQTLQLLNANKQPSLRGGNTLRGVSAAYKLKLLKKSEQQTLVAAYRFFRLVEHRLQMMHQFNTHSIPDSASEIALLAERVAMGPLGSFDPKSFVATLTKHLNKVRLLSDSFFEEKEVPEGAALLVVPDEDEFARRTLAGHGFTDTKHALSIIQSLAYGSFPNLVDRGTRGAFQELLPTLLADVSKTGDANATLVNFSNIVTASRSVGTFYRFLSDSTAAWALIRNLAATSPVLTKILARNIDMIDTILENPDALIEAPIVEEPCWLALISDPNRSDRAALQTAVRAAIDRRVLAAWVADLRSRQFPLGLASYLTQATQELVSAAAEAFVPRDRFAMFVMGSYAVAEAKLTSDVDLLVVTDDADLEPVTRGVQKVGQVLGGAVLKLDFRLRGEGESSPLVQSLSFYADYFHKRLSAWERIAFAKCGHWAGEPQSARVFTDMVAVFLTTSPTKSVLDDLIATRQKLETLSEKTPSDLETKRSAGGRYDIEYLCAVTLAREGKGYDLSMSTKERINRVVGAGAISATVGDGLRGAFDLYSIVDALIDLSGQPLPADRIKTKDRLTSIERSIDLLALPFSGDILQQLRDAKQLVRTCYDEVVRPR